MAIKILENLLINKENWELAPFNFNVNTLNFVSGGDSPTPPVPVETGNMGEIEISSIPILDENYHLLDGSLLTKTDYPDFVNYIAQLYEDDPTANYFPQPYTEANYIKEGTLTDNDGILSGFSSSDYAKLPQIFDPVDSTNWEQQWKFTTGNDVSSTQRLQTTPDNYQGQTLLLFGNKMGWYATSNNYSYSWDIADGNSNKAGSFLANTTYWLRVKFDGSQYTISQSTDGETFTNIITVSSSAKTRSNAVFTIGYGCYSYPFYGSVDMNECYIKVDDQIWWQGTTQVNDPELIWQNEVTRNGVCGKFVYDNVNETVRIPKYGSQILTDNTNLIKNSYYYMRIKE